MVANEIVELSLDESDDVRIEANYDDESVAFREYSITSYGIDFNVHGLIRRLQDDDIQVPPFQRDFVWNQSISSRFVESLLMGLPVPGIFLYRMDDDRYQVIDGQQRLKALRSFYEGSFGNRTFKLVGLESRFNDSSFKELAGSDRRRLSNSIIHATVVRQDKPDDDGTSKYSIFERLNTNAKPLSSQEIRAAIYQGRFNDLLRELNENNDWRKLFGKRHSRKRDEELILRFLALYYRLKEYGKPMKKFLSRFMSDNKNLELHSGVEIQSLFGRTVARILSDVGPHAFKPVRSINAAVFDSVMIGVASRLESGSPQSSIQAVYDDLRRDEVFQDLIAGRSSDTKIVLDRIQHAVGTFANLE